jgi:hypothetical protein
MSLHIVNLAALPKWQVKVRTQWYCGKYVASIAIPTSHGTVAINREDVDEQKAIALVLATFEELIQRMHFSALERLN